ncbi:type VI secretion system membrane subunit TssM [Azospirillum sp. HJ39]|uniref:type VI secretion system membrane subunit TssM n=1 Tax=Azospirillum sp. HJ39 TaxID=3159496 RepID=UPI00355785AA
MLKTILSALISRWFLTLVAALCLGGLVWFLGPLVAVSGAFPLADPTVRLAVAFAILLVWALAMQWSLYRHRSANDRMVQALAKATPAAKGDPDADAVGQETDLLRSRLREALDQLRQARFGGKWGQRYLYQLPWYLLIGAPGAGKTTALANSGLRFPLAAEMGRSALRDVGGTRNCDWWFTDEAVLIDTAGRYVTQDSQPAIDGKVWKNFIGLLKRHRPRQPVNGILLAVSLADLAGWSEHERRGHAEQLKLRLKELRGQVGSRVPVYVLLTKADLIAGFAEFFEDLSREEREQVWGVTFPLDDGLLKGGRTGDDAPVYRFAAEFDALTARIARRVLDRVHGESDIQRRSLDALFPAQIAGLKPAIADLLTVIFEPNRYEERPLLRGVYLTSGTQDGAPVDRLSEMVAGSFGLERPVLPAGSGGRSFFLNRTLREVVFAEAGLVGTDSGLERRRRLLRGAAMLAMLLAGLGVAAFWANSFTGNAALVAGVDAAAARAQAELEPLATAPRSLTRIDDTDFITIVPPLNTLRAIPAGTAGEPPLEMTGGLYQGDRLGRQGETVYGRALRTVLLPRIFLRMEEQLRRERGRPEYLFQALKVYLMLAGKGPLDKALVSEWMALDWMASLPGPAYDGVRRDLRVHLDTMLGAPLSTLPLDEGLVEEARQSLTRYPLAERGFAILRDRPEIQGLADWRLVDHAGPLAGRVLIRPSGKPLSEGVPGLYGYDGFHKAVLPALPKVAKALVDENWVLGQPSSGPQAVASAQRLEKGILAVYLDRYARQWDELLGDVVVVPLRSLNQAADVLNTLSGPQSPLKLWLTAMVRETTLAPGPNDKPADGKGPVAGGPLAGIAQQAQAGEKAVESTGTNAAYLARLAGVSLQPAGPPPGQPINDHFKALRDLVQGEGGAPPKLDESLKLLGELYQQIARAANAPDQNGALLAGLAGGADKGAVAAQLRNLARDLPDPIGGMVATVAQSAATVSAGGARAQINKAWQSSVLPFCRAALDNRFPMVATSPVDVTSADFSKLFAPGGMIDQFFNTNLRPFVDMTVSPWAWQKVDQVDLGIPPAVLDQFERAARIRDSLFPAGAAAAKVVFEITPVELDAKATQVALDIDGQTLIYQHGPPRPQVMKWPGAEGTSSVRLGFGPPLPGEPAGISRQGPWALFHFLADGRLESTPQPDRFTLSVTVGTRKAVFALRADSVNNPFGKNLLESFRCPTAL